MIDFDEDKGNGLLDQIHKIEEKPIEPLTKKKLMEYFEMIAERELNKPKITLGVGIGFFEPMNDHDFCFWTFDDGKKGGPVKLYCGIDTMNYINERKKKLKDSGFKFDIKKCSYKF